MNLDSRSFLFYCLENIEELLKGDTNLVKYNPINDSRLEDVEFPIYSDELIEILYFEDFLKNYLSNKFPPEIFAIIYSYVNYLPFRPNYCLKITKIYKTNYCYNVCNFSPEQISITSFPSPHAPGMNAYIIPDNKLVREIEGELYSVKIHKLKIIYQLCDYVFYLGEDGSFTLIDCYNLIKDKSDFKQLNVSSFEDFCSKIKKKYLFDADSYYQWSVKPIENNLDKIEKQ